MQRVSHINEYLLKCTKQNSDFEIQKFLFRTCDACLHQSKPNARFRQLYDFTNEAIHIYNAFNILSKNHNLTINYLAHLYKGLTITISIDKKE